MGTAARRRVAGLGLRDVVRVFRMRRAGRLPATLGPMPRCGLRRKKSLGARTVRRLRAHHPDARGWTHLL